MLQRYMKESRPTSLISGFKTDHRIKTDPDPVAKIAPLGIVASLHQTDIDRAALAAGQQLADRLDIMGHIHPKGKVIAPPDRDCAECWAIILGRTGAHQSIQDFIQGAITARGYHHIKTITCRLFRQLDGVSWRFRAAQVIIQA